MALLSRETFRNASWLTISRVARDALGFGLFVFLSRSFGPEGIGLYAYGLAIAGFAQVVVGFGFRDLGVRELDRKSVV